jgi:aminoglycoside phosphotransferase (APT) family kinase protein
MTPDDLRLLLGIRDSVLRLKNMVADRDPREVIEVVGEVVDELIKRQNRAFYAQSFRSGRCLVLEGIAALTGQDSSADVSTLDAQSRALPESLELSWNSDEVGRQLARVRSLLERIAGLLPSRGEPGVQRFLAAVIDWEVALLAPAPEPSASGGRSLPGLSVDALQLQSYLRGKFPDSEDIRVVNFERLPGGYSKVTILFEAIDAQRGRQSLVLRAEQPVTPFHMDGSNVVNEFSVLRIAHAADVPVAEPLWLEADPACLGARFIVSRRAQGKNVGDVFGGSQVLSEKTIKNVLSVLADIHNVKLDRGDPWVRASHLQKWLQFDTLAQCTREYIRYWRGISMKCGHHPSPAITRAFNWLLDNVPESDEKPGFVHGDFGLHNMMIDEERVTAVLDWEAAYAGDPADEFFLFTHVMSRYVAPATLMQWYVEAGGRRISDYRLKYFEVLNSIKAPVVGYGALELVANYSDIDVKNAYIGLRYVHLPMSNLNRAIEAAEAAKRERPR